MRTIPVRWLLSIAALLIGLSLGNAQAPFEPIFTTNFGILNVSWSSDSDSLTFQEAFVLDGGATDIGVQSSQYNSWHEYRVDTGILTTSSLWQQPYLLPQGFPIGFPTQPPTAGEGFTFLSPNNHFLIYAAERPPESQMVENPVAILDTERSTSAFLEDVPFCCESQFNERLGYSIHWSDDGTAFTMESYSPFAAKRMYYITNYAESIEEVQVIDLTTLTQENGETLSFTNILDISANGEQIFAAWGSALFVWNVDDLSLSPPIAQWASTIRGGTFTPDERNVWYIGESGLSQLNLETSETTILESNINSDWVDRAWFSPDGRHIALLDEGELLSTPDALYVVDMPTGND
jgi:hypothetical protein